MSSQGTEGTTKTQGRKRSRNHEQTGLSHASKKTSPCSGTQHTAGKEPTETKVTDTQEGMSSQGTQLGVQLKHKEEKGHAIMSRLDSHMPQR